MTTSAVQSKSGLKNLKPSEVLFNEGDIADSLFIIQKGQVRLYKPKGKGFVELAVLRAGEVIGEMAYFDEDGSGKKRSCSASAITPVEIIEVSFAAFGKTMQSLNPWFKTIINTLVARLRKTNSRIRELEDNQSSVSYNGKVPGYEFMKPIEVMRILGTLFLVFKAHGEVKSQNFVLNKKTLQLYTQDMYQIMEVKLESVLNLLVSIGWMEIGEEDSIILKNIESLRQLFIYYNSERHLPDDKKLNISEKCETLIMKMIDRASELPLVDIPQMKASEDKVPKFTKYFDLTTILNEFKEKKISIGHEQTEDGRNIGLFGEVFMKDGLIYVEVDFPKVQKLYPIIRFMNAVRRSNIEKAP